MAVPDPCLPHPRIARATEALQMFRPAASSSFRHCQLDVGREMKLLTELNFLRGKEPTRPCVRLEPSSLLPQQRAGGQRPPGTSRPPRPARSAAPRTQRTGHTVPPRSAPLLPLFVCRRGHRGLCSGAPQASQRPAPGACPPPGPPPRAPTQLCHPLCLLHCPALTRLPVLLGQGQLPSAFLRGLPDPCPSDLSLRPLPSGLPSSLPRTLS